MYAFSEKIIAYLIAFCSSPALQVSQICDTVFDFDYLPFLLVELEIKISALLIADTCSMCGPAAVNC